MANRVEYDKSSTMYSPEGRIIQVEYSSEAVKKGAPALGIRTAKGVVLAGVTKTPSRLLESHEKVFKIDEHIGATSAGYMSDSRRLTDRARIIAQSYRVTYNEPIDVNVLAHRLGILMQRFTQIGGTRPFGCALIFGGISREIGPEIVLLDTSGALSKTKATAIGENDSKAMEVLKENYKEDVSIEEMMKLAVKVLREVTEELSPEEIDLGVIDPETKTFRLVSPEEIKKAWGK
ncbi:MAG: archaeal proteasome endopeptidase complex subunit alpha [Candidatus Freyarchaeota archaeon]